MDIEKEVKLINCEDIIQFNFKVLQSHLMPIYLTTMLKVENVLEIGKGSGFVSSILNNYCNLTTLDFNKDHNPDLIVDITNLKQLDTLKDNFYDLILICEVLEHIPYEKVDGILQILKKKTKGYVIISIPNQGAYFNLTLFYHGLSRLGITALKKIVLVFSTKIVNCSGVITDRILFAILGLSTSSIGFFVIFFDLYNQLQNAFIAR